MMSAQYTNFRYLHSLPFGDFCMRPIIEDTNLRDAERSSRLFALLEPPSRVFVVGSSRAAAKELTGRLPHVAPVIMLSTIVKVVFFTPYGGIHPNRA
jgi:hypothetical protein